MTSNCCFIFNLKEKQQFDVIFMGYSRLKKFLQKERQVHLMEYKQNSESGIRIHNFMSIL